MSQHKRSIIVEPNNKVLVLVLVLIANPASLRTGVKYPSQFDNDSRKPPVYIFDKDVRAGALDLQSIDIPLLAHFIEGTTELDR